MNSTCISGLVGQSYYMHTFTVHVHRVHDIVYMYLYSIVRIKIRVIEHCQCTVCSSIMVCDGCSLPIVSTYGDQIFVVSVNCTINFMHTWSALVCYLYHTVVVLKILSACSCVFFANICCIAGNIGGHYIWQFRSKLCVGGMVRYCHTHMHTAEILAVLRQTFKFNSPPNFPAIWYYLYHLLCSGVNCTCVVVGN